MEHELRTSKQERRKSQQSLQNGGIVAARARRRCHIQQELLSPILLGRGGGGEGETVRANSFDDKLPRTGR